MPNSEHKSTEALAAPFGRDDVLIAVATGWVNLDGQEVLIREGVTRARGGSRIAQVYPGYFKPIDVHYDVEQMTAAPGERRGA